MSHEYLIVRIRMQSRFQTGVIIGEMLGKVIEYTHELIKCQLVLTAIKTFLDFSARRVLIIPY